MYAKNVSRCMLYIGLYFVFALQASLFVVPYWTDSIGGYVKHLALVYCPDVYGNVISLMVSGLVTVVAMLIAPILSTIMLVNGSVRKRHDWDVTAFILACSISMVALIGAYVFAGSAVVVAHCVAYLRHHVLNP
ncbi:hypothetical protein PENTCL1PPCAC_21574 [Pristionchus entomophagus]|uniref:G protein-coupled receptor n=1 Tax=Pristionchus entomophagus TaxID=358040 RepID=A0AAV5TZN5_9BILA|nr:hypothetical protein PENTCL1PPCAC_21574 [Pristionchus entomophagus]